MGQAGRVVNEHRLRYFFEVVKAGSIRGAAERLDVAASVVTRQIQQLERELGCRLLERHGRNVRPTEAAGLVIEHCRDRWASEELLLARLDELKGLQRGEIRIVAGEGFLEQLSQTLTLDFCKRYPNINLKLDQVSSYEVVRMVLEDEAHIGIAYCSPESGSVRLLRSRSLPVGLIAAPGHPLARMRAPIALKDVLPHRVALMQEQFGVRQLLVSAEYAEGIQFVPHFSSNSLAAVKNHVKSGATVTFLSANAVAREVATGELVHIPIRNSILEAATVQLIVRAGRASSAALQEVQRCITQMPLFASGT
ncbi:LysR family transcriptional regulator [Cupriavidus plantarum]|uniref:LysR family transcriptional regulator n=1 Tax=Cupriavidus plantarum TaxID=942865 RepID=UPI001B22F1E5|nr:LysR family transcriptional regulator [Cupriavidus plantarum]CAG2128869.1 hypothetical protein LMG26296_01460 [Cupriavidus plantarum]SMR66406.1 transcriptional regulator, LysR family [Cupriavidus plantarum]